MLCEMRYLESGKQVQGGLLEDLNVFFKGRYVRSITPTVLKQFRKFRESNRVVLEAKERSYQQEVQLRTLKLGHKPTPKELAKIEADARQWVENGVKATTNKRLTMLRAMFNHAAKEELIDRHDVPYFPMAAGVDNVRRETVSDELFEKILKEIPKNLHPYLRFLKATGMRSGQAAQMLWDNVNEDRTILTPIATSGTKKVMPLSLKDSKGKPFDWSEWIVKGTRQNGQPIFDKTDFRSQWRQACHNLKVGVFDSVKQTYRGLKPHDFRRTAVSSMTERGIDRATIKSISGHTTDSVFNRYDIKDLRQQQNAFEQMASGK